MKFLTVLLALSAYSLQADSLQTEPIGLVLSGGGAKGAYEVGVWKALVETGVATDVRAISGTSVGALNGTLFATIKDPMRIERLWYDRIGTLMGPLTDDIGAAVQEGLDSVAAQVKLRVRYVEEGKKKAAAERGIPVEDLLPHELELVNKAADTRVASDLARQAIASVNRLNKLEPLDVNIYRRMLLQELPRVWPRATPAVYVTTVAKAERCARVFTLNDETSERRADVIAASCAFPRLFNPVVIDGCEYVDGGWDGGDNTPICPIVVHHPEIKTILVVYLDDESRLRSDRVRQVDHGRIQIIEIVPSKDLQGLLGCIDSTEETSRKLIVLGCRDTLRILPLLHRARTLLRPMRRECPARREILHRLRCGTSGTNILGSRPILAPRSSTCDKLNL